MGDRCTDGMKHRWFKTASAYSKDKGLVVTEKRCEKCNAIKKVNQ